MKTIHLDKRTDSEFFAEASRLAEQYRLTLESDGKGGYVGSSIELPRVFGEGASADECVRLTRRMLTSAVAGMLKTGRTPPAPAKEGRRDEQINLRVSMDEKVLLEASARHLGFRSVSDFVRSKALESAGHS